VIVLPAIDAIDHHNEIIVLDSGSGGTYCCDANYLSDLQPINISTTKTILTADGTRHRATHVGTLRIKGHNCVLVIRNVHYTPTLKFNLLSAAAITAIPQFHIFINNNQSAFILFNQQNKQTFSLSNDNIDIASMRVVAAAAPHKQFLMYTLKLLLPDEEVFPSTVQLTPSINNTLFTPQTIKIDNDQSITIDVVDLSSTAFIFTRSKKFRENDQAELQVTERQSSVRGDEFPPLSKIDASTSTTSNTQQLPVGPSGVSSSSNTLTRSTRRDTVEFLHHLLGHTSIAKLKHISDLNAIDDLPCPRSAIVAQAKGINGEFQIQQGCPCFVCAAARGKRSRKSHRPRAIDYQRPNRRISCDVAGPVKTFVPDKYKHLFGDTHYMSLIVDCDTRAYFVRMGPTKDNATDHVIDWIAYARNVQNDRIMNQLQSQLDQQAGSKSSNSYSNLTHQKDECKEQPVGAGLSANWSLEVGESLLTYFHSDGGGEYMAKRLQTLLKQMGVTLEITTLNTPQHNAIPERAIQTIYGIARALLFHANLPSFLWPYAVLHAVLIYNMIPHHNMTKSPYESWYGNKPSVRHLHVFGCDVAVHLQTHKGETHAADPINVRGVYLGHEPDHIAGHIVWIPSQMRIVVRESVVFYDDHFSNCPIDCKRPVEVSMAANNDSNTSSAIRHDIINTQSAMDKLFILPSVDEQVVESSAQSNSSSSSSNATKRASTRLRMPVNRHGLINYDNLAPEDQEDAFNENIDAVFDNSRSVALLTSTDESVPNYSYYEVYEVALAVLSEGNVEHEPNSLSEAMASKLADKWVSAFEAERDAIRQRKTFTPFPRAQVPKGQRILTSRTLFKIKYNEAGEVIRHKARLVVRGFLQQHGIDFTDTYAPTIRYVSLRIVQAIATALSYRVNQIDISNAFLYGTIKEPVFMEQPEGMEDEKYPRSLYVFKLEKALYGLKQSPLEWNNEISNFLTGELGFIACISDPCVMRKRSRSGGIIILTIYVDDITFAFPVKDQCECDALVLKLSERYQLTSKPELSHLLGMRIQREVEGEFPVNMKIDLAAHIERLYARARCNEIPGINVPMRENSRVEIKDCPTDDQQRDTINRERNIKGFSDFRQVTGSLMYISLACRPDISFVANQLALVAHNPGSRHWDIAHKALQYLKNTSEFGLIMNRLEPVFQGPIEDYQPQITAYFDSDFANCRETRRSVTGFIIFIDGNVASWCTRRQNCVTTSTTEAEFVALATCLKEVMWTESLVSEIIGHKLTRVPILLGDNEATLKCAEKGIAETKLRHVGTSYHFVSEKKRKKEIELRYVRSTGNIADMFTKAVTKYALESLKAKFMTKVTGPKP